MIDPPASTLQDASHHHITPPSHSCETLRGRWQRHPREPPCRRVRRGVKLKARRRDGANPRGRKRVPQDVRLQTLIAQGPVVQRAYRILISPTLAWLRGPGPDLDTAQVVPPSGRHPWRK